MDSPARNPSPPPELREHSELLDAERIGNTAFSKHWLFTTLMKLIEEVDRENEEGKNTDLLVDIDEDLQNELCKLWDMSMNSEVSKFLEEFQAVDILTGIIDRSKAPRVTEICVGILGNMACDQTVCKSMSENKKLIEIILLLLESRDPPTLVEATRLIYSSISNTGTRGTWINAIQRSEEVLGHLLFIFQSSTNCDLLKNTAELVDVLLDLESDLCVSWATEDFIQALLEATEQIGSNHSDALEVYFHIFQSFSTTEPGVEALVAHLDFIVGKLMKYLNIVCEYEIVGVDRMEGPLTSALSVLNILFTSQIENKDKHCVQRLCKDEKLMRILLKILEPLYPMLEKYKQELDSNLNSNCSGSVTDSDCHVTSSDQSQSVQGTESTNEKAASDSKTNGTVDQTDVEEYRQLTVLYEVLSGFLMDYCRYLFRDTSTITEAESPVQSSNNTQECSEPKDGNSCPIAEGDNSEETKEGDNSKEVLEKDEKEISQTIETCSEGTEAGKSKAALEKDDSDLMESSSEMEKTDISKDEQPVDSSTCSVRQDESEQNAGCLPVLTYLDEACSRCRINNFALTLKSKVEENGIDLLNKIYNAALRYEKERLTRILDDINAGRIVSRAESHKILEEIDT